MTTIISKSGTGIPASDKLETAELAVDTSNGNLYTKLDDGSVVQLNDGADDVDLSDYVTEAPIDGSQYVRQDGDWAEIVIPDGGSGSSVHIGDTPPANPSEGQQWMEVPASGDATMWIYDGDKWLQHPSGKDGAPGADGNIADATEQGVIATWDDTSQQWTPEGAVVVSGGNVGIGEGSPSLPLHITSNNNSGPTSQILIQNKGGGVGATVEMRLCPTPYPGNIGSTARWSAIRSINEASGNATGLSFLTNPTSADPVERMRIDANGAISTPAMTWNGSSFYRTNHNTGGGFNFGSHSSRGIIYPVDKEGNQITDWMQLGHSTMRFRDAHFSNGVYVNGSPLTRTIDLIETLHTLREATKDETTLEGLRDAIGNAVGGLIEKFEAMQSTATQEISDE